MQNWNGQRIAAVGGILFVIGTLVSAFIVSPRRPRTTPPRSS